MIGKRRRNHNTDTGAREPARYAGSELVPLLEQVQADHGDAASIISVERVRSGGIAGFFTREQYEVLVAPPAPPAAASKPGASSDPPPEPDSGIEPEPEPEPAAGIDAAGEQFAEVLAATLAPVSDHHHPDQAAPATRSHPDQAQPVKEPASLPLPGEVLAVAPAPSPGPSGPAVNDGNDDFWSQFDRAWADAGLFEVPPVAITAVVGPLAVAQPVARRCAAQHWTGSCEVYLLTSTSGVPVEPGWTVVERGADLVAVVEQGQPDFPLLVIDVPGDLPPWVCSLLVRLRRSGVGLVHYVLDGDPTDEDLATWHGDVGRPAVLDLASPIAPERALSLLDRGEPVASIAGVPVTAPLLLALRSVARPPSPVSAGPVASAALPHQGVARG